jgi:hypothetical protein
MEQYISKSAVLAKIRKYINNAEAYLKYHHNRNDKSVYAFEQEKLAMCEMLSSLDTLEVQEEPVSERFTFKAIPRLLEMIEPTDRAKAYIAKLADTLEVEGYLTDAKIVRKRIKIMNGEKVSMATMDGEPVSEDKMTISKEWFEHCKKSWYNEGYIDGEYNRDRQFEEPVSDDLEEFINELSKQFPEVSFAKVCKIATRTAKWLLDVELPKLEEG